MAELSFALLTATPFLALMGTPPAGPDAKTAASAQARTSPAHNQGPRSK
ncbi:MAG TPA: hypothetical protein VMD53_14190 [Rhizomicrobium sp.]|nr:hypothetical protein [Rhizomicrobium sp.]